MYEVVCTGMLYYVWDGSRRVSGYHWTKEAAEEAKQRIIEQSWKDDFVFYL